MRHGPLLVVLVVQGALSARLLDANTAYADEALYLWAGHLEIASWLHGTPVPAFATYFSGAPVVYPPVAALADHLGGLAGARALSLAFMLGATAFCYGTASRLMGRVTGVLAAALFATLGVTLRLGAFATYDAMALVLLAAASYAAVRAGEGFTVSGWLFAAAAALALSNATKYATGIFDPVVVGLLLVTAWRSRSLGAAAARAATMALYLACLLGIALAMGGGEYVQGVEQTTVARQPGGDTFLQPLGESWHLIGLVVLCSGVGALWSVARRLPAQQCVLLACCTFAAMLVPLEQARIHTLTSLDKHVDFGAWYAVVPAGYALERAGAWLRRVGGRAVAVVAGLATFVLPLGLGIDQSSALFRSWPGSTGLVRAARAALAGRPGPILAEHPQLLSYYLPEGTSWYRWSSTFTIRLPHGRSLSAGVGTRLGTEDYLRLIERGYFSAVELDFGPTAAMDRRLAAALEANARYRLVSRVRYGPRGASVWVSVPEATAARADLRPDRPTEGFLRGLFAPLAHPSGVLGPVVASVEVTGVLTVLLTFGVRFGWRRRKAVEER